MKRKLYDIHEVCYFSKAKDVFNQKEMFFNNQRDNELPTGNYTSLKNELIVSGFINKNIFKIRLGPCLLST